MVFRGLLSLVTYISLQNASKVDVPLKRVVELSSIGDVVVDASLIGVIIHQAPHTRHAYHGLVAVSRDYGS